MKNDRLLFYCFILFFLTYTPGLYAQKQGKVEKLYKYLYDGDTGKLTKNREKLDQNTVDYYSAEVGLLDNVCAIMHKNDTSAIPAYFDNYVKANEKALPAIAKEIKVKVDDLRKGTEKKILKLLEESQDKYTFSHLMINEIKATNYPMDEEGMQKIIDTRESELIRSLEIPNIAVCKIYYKEFPGGKYEKQVKDTHNTLLYGALVNGICDHNFKAYFEEPLLNDYYGGLDRRPYCDEVRSAYAEYLFSLIENSKEPKTAKENREKYQTSPYLLETHKIHQEKIDNLIANIDYEWLKANVKDATNIHLIKEFLLEHPYREYREKAIKLREALEKEVIWSNPTDMRFYSGGKIMKSNEVAKNKMTATTYNYNQNGRLKSTSTVVEENKKSQEFLTEFLYNERDLPVLEEQINVKTKKPVYARRWTYSPGGTILSDSTVYNSTGMLVTRDYDMNNRLVAEREIDPKVENPLKLTTYTYNDRGDIQTCEQSFSFDPEKILPHTTRYQKDVYEYDKFGYLTRIQFEKTVGREGQINTGSLIFLYDEYGNRIDSDSYYEYDKAGRWVKKTNRNNPEEVERIMVSYN